MTKHLYLNLKETDDAVLITVNGTLKQGFFHSPEDGRKNADALQGLMIEMMKNEEAHRGLWFWKITEHWNSIEGWEI